MASLAMKRQCGVVAQVLESAAPSSGYPYPQLRELADSDKAILDRAPFSRGIARLKGLVDE